MADQAGPSSAAPVPQDPALLAEADGKFEEGVKCIKEGAMERAVQLFSEVLQVRAKHYGELAPQCASAYYRYGSALLYQAQDSSDVLGAPLSGGAGAAEVEDGADEKENEERPSSATAGSGASEGGAGGSSAAADDKGKGKAPAASEEGGDEEEDEESGGDAESDLQLAWEHLEAAKTIWAQQPDTHTLQLADVHLLLGDVGCENEDFEGALADYDHSLAYLQKGAEGGDRRVAEVQYKRCMALQFLDRPKEALEAVQAAIASLDARTAHLKEQLGAEGAEAAEKERAQHELEDIAAVNAELADKVEELKDAMEQHLSTKNVLQSALASLSQLEKPPQQQQQAQQAQQQRPGGAAAAGGPQEQQGFDNPAGGAAAGTGSGAEASAPVKDLGVVGRGTKRLNLAPVQVNATAGSEAAAPAAKKKRSLEDLMGGDGAEGETTIGFGSAPDSKPAPAPPAAVAAADTKAAPPVLPAFLQPAAVQAVYGGGSGSEEQQAGGQ